MTATGQPEQAGLPKAISIPGGKGQPGKSHKASTP